jgi:transcription antitermination factor NusG
VPEHDIAAVRMMVESNERVEPWPYLQAGDRVRLHCGPLAGIEGIVVQLRTCTRVIVQIDILRRAVAAEVDPNWIEQIPSRGSSMSGRHVIRGSVAKF